MACSEGGAKGAIDPTATGAESLAPGERLHSADVAGAGACAGKTVFDVAAAVRAAWPSLADITRVQPEDGFDGSYVVPFALADGAFALVFERGWGDCPAGCIHNEYWYFQTDEACAPRLVGHYAPSRTDAWLQVEGAPMWGVPMPPDPASVCGADNSPQPISGTYVAAAKGQSVACAAKGSGEPVTAVEASLTMVVAHDADDPSKGTVTFTGTGHPLVDGKPLPARSLRQRFEAELADGGAPTSCLDEWSITAKYDFERDSSPGAAGSLRLFEARDLSCPGGGGGYCKGVHDVTLAAAK